MMETLIVEINQHSPTNEGWLGFCFCFANLAAQSFSLGPSGRILVLPVKVPEVSGSWHIVCDIVMLTDTTGERSSTVTGGHMLSLTVKALSASTRWAGRGWQAVGVRGKGMGGGNEGFPGWGRGRNWGWGRGRTHTHWIAFPLGETSPFLSLRLRHQNRDCMSEEVYCWLVNLPRGKHKIFLFTVCSISAHTPHHKM